MLSFLLAAALQAAPVTDTAADLDVASSPVLDAADRSIAAGRPQEALDALAPMIAAFERRSAGDPRQQYCAMTPAQALAYMAMAASAKRDAVAQGPNWCRALYLRGFALFDLNRVDEARASYERAAALAPMHSHFLLELGQTWRVGRDWAKMLDYCTRAEGVVLMAQESDCNREYGFAWRCQGFALIEQGKWDEAELRFRRALQLDPTDAKAKNELQYIAEQRRRPRA